MLLSTLSLGALLWCWARREALYYGDAEAHLNIARRILDSRTPGLREVGTVWLPLPHLLMAPFAAVDALWRSGVAGGIPVAVCYVIAGTFFFAAARRLYGGVAAATTLAVFALNPNLLYLEATPMTEPIFFAALGGLFYGAVRLREEPSPWLAVGAGAAAFAASLTRYEGWFLIPFVALYFLRGAPRGRGHRALLFTAIALLGPSLWLAHNWRWWGDPLEFLRATCQASTTQSGARNSGVSSYPGDHDWARAWLYYWNAAELCAGLPLMILGAAGVVVSVRKRAGMPLLLLLPTPLFYVWTIHSAGIRLFVPQLYPFASYNTRYGLAALPLLAVASGALVAGIPARRRRIASAVVTFVAIFPWLTTNWPENSACWKEARDTSKARRAWTQEAASYLRGRYRPGDGIVMSFGDAAGVLREAGIPLRDALTQDNGSDWQAAVSHAVRPAREAWALASDGDSVSRLVDGEAPGYVCDETIRHTGAPTIEVCHRGAGRAAVSSAGALPARVTSSDSIAGVADPPLLPGSLRLDQNHAGFGAANRPPSSNPLAQGVRPKT